MSAGVRAAAPSREQLLYALHEAAEVEHLLMGCYLYAALSLKQDDAAWTPAQREAVARWRGSLMAVVFDEMTHLALVANLAQALGGTAWFGRPPYPVDAGPYPAGLVIRLQPFSQATIEHFMFLERPQSHAVPRAQGFEPAVTYRREVPLERLSPGARDYDTVGELYEGLRAGLGAWVARDGEAAVFVGDPRLQVDAQGVPLRGLRAVRGWADAQLALDTIVTQGEGAGEENDDSHFSRFARMADELAGFSRTDPDFAPAWPAAVNPVMNPPIHSASSRVHIAEPAAAAWLDVGNALYTSSLRCLMQGFAATSHEAKAAWLDASFVLMRELVPVGQALAAKPAATDGGCHAGLSLTPLRPLGVLPEGSAPVVVLERLSAIRQRLAGPPCAEGPFAASLGQALRGLEARLSTLCAQATGTHRAPASADGSAPAPAISAAASPVPADARSGPPAAPGLEEVRGRQLTILFDAARCIHARHCVLEAPQAFKANTPGAWIDPDAVPIDELVLVARRCPSGAIRYLRHDGAAQEPPPEVNVLRVRENGPYALHAPYAVAGGEAALRATLCRCGQSRRKPWCDGSHVEAGFRASGEPDAQTLAALPERGGALAVQPLRDGPLELAGALEICSGTGRTVARGTSFRLCRCGQSQVKPFCDGSHRSAGFVAEGA